MFENLPKVVQNTVFAMAVLNPFNRPNEKNLDVPRTDGSISSVAENNHIGSGNLVVQLPSSLIATVVNPDIGSSETVERCGLIRSFANKIAGKIDPPGAIGGPVPRAYPGPFGRGFTEIETDVYFRGKHKEGQRPRGVNNACHPNNVGVFNNANIPVDPRACAQQMGQVYNWKFDGYATPPPPQQGYAWKFKSKTPHGKKQWMQVKIKEYNWRFDQNAIPPMPFPGYTWKYKLHKGKRQWMQILVKNSLSRNTAHGSPFCPAQLEYCSYVRQRVPVMYHQKCFCKNNVPRTF